MEVEVDSFVEALDGERTHINHAYFTMVALDENDRPAPVPELSPETEEEKAKWERARKRKEARLMEASQFAR